MNEATPDRVIFNAAWAAITRARKERKPEPAVWVISYEQRHELRIWSDPISGPYAVGKDVDTLFGIPILTVSEDWSCLSNLTDLRGAG